LRSLTSSILKCKKNFNYFLKWPASSEAHTIFNGPVIANSFGDLLSICRQLHSPWTTAPRTPQEFAQYIERIRQPNQKELLVVVDERSIAGVFNINEIVFGCFQSVYLGFYATVDYAGRGIMSAALKLVLLHIFEQLKLHRIEANIQPGNEKSIRLVQSRPSAPELAP